MKVIFFVFPANYPFMESADSIPLKSSDWRKWLMKAFAPDYRNAERAARNMESERFPLYEHIITEAFMEKALNREFAALLQGDEADKKEFFRIYTRFFRDLGYDTVSFEQCIGLVMPGSGALGGHIPGVIQNRGDFERYPWKEIPPLFFSRFSDDFRILREVMPEGMKAIGGPGNGVFECVQDLVGYTGLCYMKCDDPELFSEMFKTIGDVMVAIWTEFAERFGDIYAVLRFGDDLGFKSDTLISPQDIIQNIIPQYRRITDVVHAYHKPFLLHSCGNIFNVMEDLIHTAKIDAKHSNEDQIAPFSVWVERYGDRIGNFGGVDLDVLCCQDEKSIRDYVRDVIGYTKGHGGFALGSGNSIPFYVPVEGFMTMIETAREMRGDYSCFV